MAGVTESQAISLGAFGSAALVLGHFSRTLRLPQNTAGQSSNHPGTTSIRDIPAKAALRGRPPPVDSHTGSGCLPTAAATGKLYDVAEVIAETRNSM